MCDSGWKPTEDDFPKPKRMTDEQIDLMNHMLDITRDTTKTASKFRPH